MGGGGWNSRELIRSPILVFILILILKSVKCVFEIRAIAIAIAMRCDAMRFERRRNLSNEGPSLMML